MNPVRMGVGLLEHFLGAGRTALSEVEDELKRDEWRLELAPIRIAGSLVRGCRTFVGEVTRLDGRVNGSPPSTGVEQAAETPPVDPAGDTVENDARVVSRALSDPWNGGVSRHPSDGPENDEQHRR